MKPVRFNSCFIYTIAKTISYILLRKYTTEIFRRNQLPVSADRWDHGFRECFALKVEKKMNF
jgi:hypothetical protein